MEVCYLRTGELVSCEARGWSGGVSATKPWSCSGRGGRGAEHTASIARGALSRVGVSSQSHPESSSVTFLEGLS